MAELQEILSRFYSIFPWTEDPYSKEGKERFENTLKFMEQLVNHRWLRDLLSKKSVIRVLEICGGTGIGGVALAKILMDKGINVYLLITDLRKAALNIAEKWSLEVLGKGVDTLLIDAREVHKLDSKFDILLLYGLSTPHFNPWDMVKLFTSVSKVLVNDGLFIIDEGDRRYALLTQGYKHVLAEYSSEERFVVSFHIGYNLVKGSIKRTYVDLIKQTKPVTMELFMWGLAEVAALTWVFFENVDLVKLERTRHFIIGYKPRRILTPECLSEPSVLIKFENTTTVLQ